ncbi:MAG: carbohydrate binding family 9 domain-containing protein [Gemmatimonadales bacterium]|nr:carbohydrate binding family 9 domain-containing protein [Gemmatimonadales bacterium]
MSRYVTAVAALLLFTSAPSAITAQAVNGADVPTMRAYRLEGSISIDGRLDEEIWSRFPAAKDFVQKEPVEGDPALNDSEAWILYDDDAIYMGALVRDATPETIMRNMNRRDAVALGQYDYFEVMFDPNLDGRTGYRFRVTAANVQTDRYLYDDAREDAAWNAVWESAVRIVPEGWTIEFRIPLSQIRYESADGPQTWGINFGRRRISDNELTRFALESSLVTGRVSQFGLIEGIDLVGSPSRAEARPYVVSTARSAAATPGNPFFDGSDMSARAGFDLRYGLGSAFTLDAAINPDFGQVEADPAVVNLTAFETFFQEQRPFFVEDARVFDFPLSGSNKSVFYTRRIGRAPRGRAPSGADFTDAPEASTILAATKITGRTANGLSVGAMAALTEQEEGSAFFSGTGEITEFTVEPRAGFGIVRIEQDLNGGGSNIGGIFTALKRSLPGDGSFDDLTSSSFNAGVDFGHHWSNRGYYVGGFLANTHVRGDAEAITRIQRASNHYRQRPDLAWAELDSTATQLTGAEWRLQAEKRRGSLRWSVWAAQVTPDFEVNDIGFSTSPERVDGGASLSYQQIEPTSIFRKYNVRLTTFHNFSHEAFNDVWSLDSWDQAHTAGTFSANVNTTLNNFWTVNTSTSYTPDRMSRTLTRGGPMMIDPAVRSFTVSVGNDNRSFVWVRSSLNLQRGTRGSGSSTRASLGLSVQPSARLRLSFDPRLTWAEEGVQYVTTSGALPFPTTYGDRYLFADIERRSLSAVTRANYTFTPDLTFEFYSQALLSSGDYTRYKQLAAPETYSFDAFEEGTYSEAGGTPTCLGGRTCENSVHTRFIDFDGNGTTDSSFQDRDFNVRSLRTTAVLRWEYRPGSTIFFVWQRRQAGSSSTGDFDFGRDLGAMFDANADDRFIMKVNLWLSN